MRKCIEKGTVGFLTVLLESIVSGKKKNDTSDMGLNILCIFHTMYGNQPIRVQMGNVATKAAMDIFSVLNTCKRCY